MRFKAIRPSVQEIPSGPCVRVRARVSVRFLWDMGRIRYNSDIIVSFNVTEIVPEKKRGRNFLDGSKMSSPGYGHSGASRGMVSRAGGRHA